MTKPFDGLYMGERVAECRQTDPLEESLERILRLRNSAEEMRREADELEKKLTLEVEAMYREAEQRAVKIKSALSGNRF